MVEAARPDRTLVDLLQGHQIGLQPPEELCDPPQVQAGLTARRSGPWIGGGPLPCAMLKVTRRSRCKDTRQPTPHLAGTQPGNGLTGVSSAGKVSPNPSLYGWSLSSVGFRAQDCESWGCERFEVPLAAPFSGRLRSAEGGRDAPEKLSLLWPVPLSQIGNLVAAAVLAQSQPQSVACGPSFGLASGKFGLPTFGPAPRPHDKRSPEPPHPKGAECTLRRTTPREDASAAQRISGALPKPWR